MEQRCEPPLSPQVRALQLELVASQQRERQLTGEVGRLRHQLEEQQRLAADDRIGPLTRKVQELEREVFQARQAEHAARREAAKLSEAGAEQALKELADLRGWKAEQNKRDRDQALVLDLERQKAEARIAELVKGHRAETDALRAQLTAATKGGKKR